MASAAKTKRTQLKPITAIIVLLLLVASLLIAGCANLSSSPGETPPATAANTVKNTSKTLVKPSATLITPSASAAPAPKFTPPAPVKYNYHVAIVVHCAGTMCNNGYSEYYGDLQPYYANNPRVTTTLTHGNTLYNATFENGAPNANWVSATILETGQVVYFQWGYGTPVKQWVDNVLAA